MKNILLISVLSLLLSSCISERYAEINALKKEPLISIEINVSHKKLAYCLYNSIRKSVKQPLDRVEATGFVLKNLGGDFESDEYDAYTIQYYVNHIPAGTLYKIIYKNDNLSILEIRWGDLLFAPPKLETFTNVINEAKKCAI